MDIDKIVTSVDVERLYAHVLALEGVRNPLTEPKALEKAEEYILSEFQGYGLTTNIHEFQPEDMDQSFRNVEGFIGDGKEPEFLIVAHHDTQPNAPGANDNASGVAVMLETARVLQQAGWSGNVRFISFTLHETHPGFFHQERMLERQYGIIDDKNRYTSWRLGQLLREHRRKTTQFFYSGLNLSEASEKAVALIGKDLSKTEREFFSEGAKLFEDVTITNWIGKINMVGSSYWVDDALSKNKQMEGVIDLADVGYTSKEPHSQNLEGVPVNLLKTYGTQDLTVADYLRIIGDCNSAPLANSFCSHAQRKSINLPYACLQGNFTYEQATQTMGAILQSDHAPFWRAGIPALLIISGDDPYHHTPADTINNLDFNFMTKVCQATIGTTIELATKHEK